MMKKTLSPDKVKLLPDSDVETSNRRRSILLSDSMTLPPIKEDGDDLGEASSSGYETVPKEPIGQFLSKSFSVPNLHSKSKLDEETREIGANHYHISYISDAKDFIVNPSGSSIINKNKSSSESVSNASTKQEQYIKGRTTKILEHLKGVPKKVETELYHGGLNVLEDPFLFPLVILIGTGCGITFIAKMLFEKLLRDDQDAIGYCFNDPKECWSLNPDKRAIITGFDVSGSNYYNKILLSKWFDWLKEVMPIGSKRNNKTTVVLTMKNYEDLKEFRPLQLYSQQVVNANEERYRPSKLTIQALERSIREQLNVQMRWMKVHTSSNSRFVDQDVVDKIPSLVGRIGHVHKLTCFYQNHLSMGIDYFSSPDPKTVRQFRDYAKTSPPLFLALLAVYAHNGQLGIGRLSQMARINHAEGRFWQSVQSISTVNYKEMNRFERRLHADFPKCVIMFQYARKYSYQTNLVNNLERFAQLLDGKYLDKCGDTFQFMNRNVFSSFLVVLCELYPESMKSCDRDFFFNHIKPNDENTEPDTCLRVDTSKGIEDTVVKSLMVRFKDEILEERQVAKVMGHAVMYPAFFEKFLQYLSKTPRLTWRVLSELDIDSTYPYCCLLHGLQNDGKRPGNYSNNTDVIIRHGKWKKKREEKDFRENTYLQEQETLLETAKLNIYDTFQGLVEMGVKIPIEALQIAIDHQYTSIIDCIVRYGKFTNLEWYDQVLRALEILSNGPCLQDLIHQTKQMMFKVDVRLGQMTPYLFHAIRSNDMNMVRTLLDEALIPERDLYQRYSGHKPLSEASRLGHVKIVQYLLGNEAINEDAVTEAIQTSCDTGFDGVMKTLLQQYPCYIHNRNHLERLMFLSVQHGHLGMVNAIFKAYSDVMVEDPDETHRKTKLSDKSDEPYAKCKHCNLVEPSNPLYVRNNIGQSVLHVAAAERGLSTLVSLLIEKGLDVNELDIYDETPLSLACKASDFATLRAILDEWNRKGYSLDDRIVLRNVQENNIHVLSVLREYGFRINFVNKMYGVPIHVATQYKMDEMMKYLLKNGADPNAKHSGWAPLHITAKVGDLQRFRMLISYGADVLQTEENSRNTFVHLAAQESRTIFVDEILKSMKGEFDIQSLVNQVNAAGETALHIAARKGCSTMVELLLKHGCRPNIKNKSGLRPLDVINTMRQQNKNESHKFERCKKLLQTKY